MKKEIIISAPNNEVTGLAQRRVLTGISVTPHTGHATLTFDVEQLDLKGNPLDLSYQNRQTDKIEFHSQLINTPEGVQGGELAQHEIDFLQGIYDLTETFLTAHEAETTEDEE